MKVRIAVVLSIALHSVVFSLLLLGVRPKEKKPQETVFIEVEPSATAPQGEKGAVTRSLHAGKRKGGGSIRGKFAPPVGWGKILREGPPSDAEIGEGQVASDGDVFQVAKSMGFAKEGQMLPFLDMIWRRIERNVPYPKSFAENHEQGTITLQLVVDHQGRFSGEMREVRGDSPGLMAYTTAAVIASLEEPLPPIAWRPEGERWALGVEFNYRLKFYGGDTVDGYTGFRGVTRMKNLLQFQREGWADSPVNRAINDFVVRYFPPIIPTPAGFFLDLGRTYELIQNLANKGKKPDSIDRRKIRRDSELEQWRTVIRRKGSVSANGSTSDAAA
jgi:hypothetical protein